MKRNTCRCELCGKDISLSNYNRHLRGHSNHPENYKETRLDLNCKYCKKNFKSLKAVVQHEIRCKDNPDIQENKTIITGFNNKGRTAWNKGLTKYTNSGMKKNSESNIVTMRNKINNGWKPYFATADYWTPERCKERSEIKKLFYTEHPEKHPSRILAYNRKTASYLEVIVKEWLDKNAIIYIHQYRTNFKDGYRIVDFYIPDYNLYIEVDGKYWHANSKDIDQQKDLFAKEVQKIDTLRLSSDQRIEEELKKYFSGCMSSVDG